MAMESWRDVVCLGPSILSCVTHLLRYLHGNLLNTNIFSDCKILIIAGSISNFVFCFYDE